MNHSHSHDVDYAKNVLKNAMDIPQTRPYIPEEDKESIMKYFEEILSSRVLINGPFTEAFEREMAKTVGTRHAISIHSCTAALETILEFINVRDGEVIVPVNTFIATSNAVLFAGGMPVFVDMGENLLLDVDKIEEKVSKKTKAIIIVHLAGYIHPDIARIRHFCESRSLFLIEDAAHAHGASLNGKMAGSLGYAAAFSFYATKVLTTGIGGMITTDDDALAERVRSVRFHGEDHRRGIQNRLGRDLLITEFQAALGLVQLRRLPDTIKRRMAIARQCTEGLKDVKGIKLFSLNEGAVSGYYKFPIRIVPPFSRDTVAETLTSSGIKVGNAYWPPIHLQPAYRDILNTHEGQYPNAERILQSTVTLPLFPDMSDDEVQFVISTLKAAMNE